MGQRLVIRNTLNGKFVNEVYWHSSGFTDLALFEAWNIAESIKNMELHSNDDFNRAYYEYVSKSYGGLVTENERERVLKMLEGLKIQKGDRYFGIIAFEEDEGKLICWTDTAIIIDWATKDGKIDKENTFLNVDGMFQKFETAERYEEFMKLSVSDLTTKNIDFSHIPLSMYYAVMVYIWNSIYGFIDNEGKVYSKYIHPRDREKYGI